MRTSNFRKYLEYVRKKGNFTVPEKQLEKDFKLSEFLSTLQNLIEDGKITAFKDLIFKGGTLLTKNYLEYHRISEDLDFTHSQCDQIRLLETSGKRECQIRPLAHHLLNEIKLISEECGLEFKEIYDSDNIQIINNRAIYRISLHYKSVLDKTNDRIKLEINFVEKLQNKSELLEILNIVDHIEVDTAYLASIEYNLQHVIMPCYKREEIILEKFRALLTRKDIPERDMLDLFLINRQFPVFKTPITSICEKIRASFEIISPDSEDNLKKHCADTAAQKVPIDLDEIKNLSLRSIDLNEYKIFRDQLLSFLQTLCSNV